MARILRSLRDGRTAVVAAAVWALFDALVHVAVDMVEPLRIAGNVTVWIGAALVLLGGRLGVRGRLAAAVCGLAAGLVLGLNWAWASIEGELPTPAAIFIGVALALLVWAAYRFLVTGDRAEDGWAKA